MLNPKDFKIIPDWMLGGYWADQKFTALDGTVLDTKAFGDNQFHGRTHPAICYCMLEKFTEPDDWVYIPFAGSGTEVDVCKKFGRQYVAIDINPQRNDIVKGDATEYVCHDVKLIIAHPPYESCIVYSSDQNDLSRNGEDYKVLVSRCAQRFAESLSKGGIAVVIVGDTYHGGQEWPLDFVWHEAMVASGFRLIGRIFRDFGETKAKGKNKNLWKYRLLKFKRFKLETDFVLVYERVGDKC